MKKQGRGAMTSLGWLAIAGVSLVFSACSWESENVTAAGSEDADLSSNEVVVAAVQPDGLADGAGHGSATSDALDTILVDYGRCHRLLAADELEGIVECARGVEASAQSARSVLSGETDTHLLAVATAAGTLAETPHKLNALRLAFGEVSRALIVVLDAVPEASGSYHVFKCPMTMSYKRWIQTDTELVNPYMGTSMLDCGYEVE